MTKEMMLIRQRFGLSESEAEHLEQDGLYGIFVMPSFDNKEKENEIHLKHQLFEKYQTKDERLVAEKTECVTFEIKEGNLHVTSTHFE